MNASGRCGYNIRSTDRVARGPLKPPSVSLFENTDFRRFSERPLLGLGTQQALFIVTKFTAEAEREGSRSRGLIRFSSEERTEELHSWPCEVKHDSEWSTGVESRGKDLGAMESWSSTLAEVICNLPGFCGSWRRGVARAAGEQRSSQKPACVPMREELGCRAIGPS